MDQKLKVDGERGEDIEGGKPVDVPMEALHPIDQSTSGPDLDPEYDFIESLAGQTFDNRYLIQDELARGGMGVVFKAQHLSLNRPVVIKVLKSAQTESNSAKARFEREARRACQLDHPNIVTVHDFGYHGDLGYLVMEYVGGVTLYEYLKRNGPMTFPQFAPVVAAICSGLGEAHRQGIVHRDIKASNIMLTFDDGHLRRVKILDFGLAKAEGSKEDDVTRQSALMGTMGAMPPERILCKPTDCRVDLYALGITAYRMIAGRRPFVGDDMHVLYQHVHEHPAPLTDLLPAGHEYPIMVLEWVHRLLAKEPDDRPRDGLQAREWLFETVLDKSIFRIDEARVKWSDLSATDNYAGSSGTFDVTDPSWSITSSPSGSYRSLISNDRVAPTTGPAPVAATTNLAPPAPAPESAVLPVKPQRSAVPIVVGVAALSLVGIAAVAASQLTRSEPAPAEPAAPATVAAPASQRAESAEDIDKVFARVESDLQRGAYATAEILLNSVRDQLASRTEYQVRAAEFQAQIDIDKNLRKARIAEEKLQIEDAVRLYDSVLSLDAGQARARERMDQLTSQVVLKVSSDPPGSSVYVDGKQVGTTPLERLMPSSFSNVEVRRDGYRTWSTSLIPDGGTRIELAAELYRPGKKVKPTTTTPPLEKRKDGIQNENLMGMDD